MKKGKRGEFVHGVTVPMPAVQSSAGGSAPSRANDHDSRKVLSEARQNVQPFPPGPLPLLRITLLVGADQLGLGEHMTFDGAFDVSLGERLRRKRCVERVQLMEVTVPAGGRTRTVI